MEQFQNIENDLEEYKDNRENDRAAGEEKRNFLCEILD